MAKPQLVRKNPTVALVGGESLLGREVRDVCTTSGFPAHLSLVAAGDEEVGVLTESEGEPAVIGRLDRYSLGDARVALLAGTVEATRQALALETETALVDLTGAAEESPRARVRAPGAEPAGFAVPGETIHVIAHPAAIALAMALNRLHARYPVKRSVATVFEPASGHGRAGIDEFQQQVTNLLTFKGLPKAVFDAQAAFNMLAQYGEEAPETLESVELRMERHLATLLGQASRAPRPSLRLIHAPVFHGYSISLWVLFAENPGAAAVEKALSSAEIDVRGGDLEAPDAVGIAGQSGIAVGDVRMDRGEPNACWLWLVADNLRLTAENAVAVARELL